MRIIHDSYTPDGFWFHVYDEPPDWKTGAERLRNTCGPTMSRDFLERSPAIGDRIYSFGALEVLSNSENIEWWRRRNPRSGSIWEAWEDQ